MRRALAIAASAAMMLIAGDLAMAQTPNPQPRTQAPSPPPNMPLIKPSQAVKIALSMMPNSKAVAVKLLPGGNYAVTLRRNSRLERVIINGDTGDLAPR
jgi:hypothetical protein